MGKDAGSQLDARLNAYAATVHASAITNALKRSAEKWPVYAAVTGAAMAMASNASASIIYSGVINAATATSTGHGGAGGSHHRSARGNTRTNIALGNATGDKLGIRIAVMRSQSLYGIYFRGNIELSGKGMSFLASTLRLKRLSSGAKISGGGHFRASGGQIASWIEDPDVIQFGWRSTEGLVGFEFRTANKHQQDFGWVRLQYTLGGGEGFNRVKVIDWAYDSTGASILAGQEAEIAPSPEPSTMALMLLAAGAACVEALRRRRETAKTR